MGALLKVSTKGETGILGGAWKPAPICPGIVDGAGTFLCSGGKPGLAAGKPPLKGEDPPPGCCIGACGEGVGAEAGKPAGKPPCLAPP